MYYAMVMAQHSLARTRTEDEASNNKTIENRLGQWIKWDMDSNFLRQKLSENVLAGITQNDLVDEYKEFIIYKSTVKSSNAI